MSLYLHVAQLDNLDEILDFENKILKNKIPDESERMIASWNLRSRKESLEHYLNIGWSFIARDTHLKSHQFQDGPIAGFFIAQPLLFFDGFTQSLWVEHISFETLEARDQLCEMAYKLGREKHLQKVYFPNNPEILRTIQAFKASEWQPKVYEVKTTKI